LRQGGELVWLPRAHVYAIQDVLMLTDLEISSQHAVLEGKTFGSVGPYEQLHGSARFAVDPDNVQNARIVDIDLAPRNADGLVTCRADIWILRPVEPERGNGALMYHVVNRGKKGVLGTYNLAVASPRPETEAHFGDGYLMEAGYTVAACGWQADVPTETPEDKHLMTFDVPVPTRNGEPITGPVGCEIIVDEPCDLHSLGSRFHTPYEVAEGTEQTATLTVREKPYDEHRPIARGAWQFERMSDGRPAIRYPAGFEPGLIYSLVYTGRDPRVMGLGFASTRDFVSCLKYETDRFDALRGTVSVSRAHAFGSSQSGRFLRHLVYEGFNEDEHHRKVFDGLFVNVAGGGLGSFNHRFAQPSRHSSAHFDVYYPTEQFPFTDLPETDPIANRTAGLLDRSEASNTIPRIFYTNTSTEYWNRSASLTHTDLTGSEDLDVHPSVRIYHFAGSQHGPADLPTSPDPLPKNPVNFRFAHRALLAALDQWVASDEDPPESQHSSISDGTLVTPEEVRNVWPESGLTLPSNPREPARLNHGRDWAKGVIENEPPLVGERYTLLVPNVDSDGNEQAGIRLPEVAVPLGAFAGWRLRSEEMGATWAMIGLQGFWHPFSPEVARSRYENREGYITRCRASAETLVEEGYLLARDLPRIEARAGQMYDWVMKQGE
jgi:hypothetical protein